MDRGKERVLSPRYVKDLLKQDGRPTGEETEAMRLINLYLKNPAKFEPKLQPDPLDSNYFPEHLLRKWEKIKASIPNNPAASSVSKDVSVSSAPLPQSVESSPLSPQTTSPHPQESWRVRLQARTSSLKLALRGLKG
jgi:hypothetical protein